jgi:hypothetical protein
MVRTSGTFSYISGYTAFLSFIGFLAIGYNMTRGWRLKKNMAPVLALALVIGAMFTTGSRGPVWTVLATGPVILWLAATRGVLSSRTAMRLCGLIPVIAIVALSVSPQATDAFMARAAGGGGLSETLERLFSPLYQTIGALSDAPVLGMGIGTTHPSAMTIMGAEWPWWLEDLLTEDEMARVTVELGVIGLILVYSLRFLVAAFALRCAMTFKDPSYRALGIVLAVYLALGVIEPIMLNVTLGLYYWGSLGLVLTMRRLEQSAGARFGTVPVRRADQITKLQPVMPMGGAVHRRPS